MAHVKLIPEDKQKHVNELNKHFDKIVGIIETHAKKDGRYKKMALRQLNEATLFAIKALAIPL